ncbi:MAG: BadF/BadG/BcrA/BcrD ATPase family protein [Bradymonadia bacterium]|jgi:activator of 2-hydroxyglutaryl-CoA dehydratase/predicted nucleotide-binding protein (sugar kinase/HSP70/actin superfamily)
MSELFLGLDIGAECVKYALLERDGKEFVIKKCASLVHEKEVEATVKRILEELSGYKIAQAAATGRFARQFRFASLPQRAAQREGLSTLLDDEPVTLVSIACRGFSVFERRNGSTDVFRENSRCSQGTGNFLRQLVERFNLNLEQADELCETVEDSAALSGRCPVILKTDMTHLANKGESRSRILAGVYDAICENVQALIKPKLCPKRVMLIGGVSRSARIRAHFRRFCAERDLEFLEIDEQSSLYLEAIGAASLAAKAKGARLPETAAVFVQQARNRLDRLGALREHLAQVQRLKVQEQTVPIRGSRVILGFDIGSTGSKAAALLLDSDSKQVLSGNCVWEGYLRTNGDPIGAAKALVKQFCEQNDRDLQVAAFGVTGSGREIVASLLGAAYKKTAVYVVNEIVAHAEAAIAIDPSVDTIFEIGGQDAKYIRLNEGKIVDAAMNEACSAGTGSFIEEQGKKFKSIESVAELSDIALSADAGVSLGRHCSVFMTEVIDEAIASGESQAAIIAGIFDSIILNYFFRVKANRSVGSTVFCQGMPFSSDALAAAVARQTMARVIVPPKPGMMGAYGIGLLARKAGCVEEGINFDLELFLRAEIVERNTFTCRSIVGCGGKGNLCKIDKLRVRLNDKTFDFNWGGACSLWDKGSKSEKLPDLCPNPFAERLELVDAITDSLPPKGRKSIAISEEFQTKTLFAFFANYFYALGYDVHKFQGGRLSYLKRGLEESNVQFCAPMQHFHGVAAEMVESDCDYLFLPMMRSGKFAGTEEYSVICPIVQSCADIIKHDFKLPASRMLSPVIDLGIGNFESKEFKESCARIAKRLGVSKALHQRAFEQAREAQQRFDEELQNIGRRCIDYAKENDLDIVVVLGRNYTIHNNALNSNVPNILRNQGMLALPVDTYPIETDVFYESVYWTYGQLNLRAATQIRHTPRQFALWCSNYACGPDSFNLHFLSFIMDAKPYCVIETDGHSGDAGTKTRVEAFLHCVKSYEASQNEKIRDLAEIERRNAPIKNIIAEDRVLLIPPMGDNARIIAAGFRGLGMRCETLPIPTRKTLAYGRRYTSGKECLPMHITLGSLLERVDESPDEEKLAFFMPRSNGPCRLGCYNLLDKIILERLGLTEKVKIWSLSDTDYSEGVPMVAVMAIYTAFVACDTLMAALYDIRPIEKVKGKTEAIYQKYLQKLVLLLENLPKYKFWRTSIAKEILTGNFFGIAQILKDAAAEFAENRTNISVPTVLLTGEIYVRNDPFANDFMIDALERRGLRVLFAHFSEWIEYADVINREILKTATSFTDKIASELVRHIINKCYAPMARALKWPQRHSVPDILKTAQKYLRKDLVGEEILSIGTPLHAWNHKQILGVVNVGPLECMPSKIAESQFFHVAELEGLPSITLAFNGDPISDNVIDDFAFEIHQRFADTRLALGKL